MTRPGGDEQAPRGQTRTITDDVAPPPDSPPHPPEPLVLPWPPLHFSDPNVALRPWGASPGDATTLAAAWSDPEIARWTTVPEACTVADAERWVVAEGARRDTGMALDLAIIEAGALDAVIGEVGLVLVEADRRWAEVGYWLLPAWRGSGRAAVALTLFTDWVLSDLPIRRLFARTHVDNGRAGAVAQRAGYEQAGELGDGFVVWVRDAPTA